MIKEFDKVFVINVASYKERRQLSKEKLETIGMQEGLDYEFFRATTGKSKFAKLNGEESVGWNRNAAGLVYTTRRIIETAKKNKWKSVLIFEDDINFINNFTDLYPKAIKDLPEEYDFFHLNATNTKPPIWHKGMLHKIKEALCCQAYAIHESVYDIYLDELKKSCRPIDETTRILHKQRGRSYCTRPNLVYHVENLYSSLRERIVHY